MKIGYIVEAMPTFVVREIEELRRQGVPLSLYSVFDLPSGAPMREETYFPSAAQALVAGVLGAVQSPIGFAHLMWRALALRSKPAKVVRALAIARCAHVEGVSQFHGTFATWPAEQAALAAAYLGVPYSFTVHAYDVFKDNANLEAKARNAAGIRTISDYNRRELARRFSGHAGKIHTVRLGVRVPKEQHGDKGGERVRVLSVGRMVEKKGFDDLICAVDETNRAGGSLTLTLVGDGPARDQLEALVERLGLADVVSFAGALENERVHKLINEHDIAALACKMDSEGDMDGIPVFLMEAMAVGMPTVSTSLSGIPELIEDGKNGRVVPPGDVSSLADALSGLSRDPTLRVRLGGAGRERVQEDFELRRQTQKFIHFLASLEAAE